MSEYNVYGQTDHVVNPTLTGNRTLNLLFINTNGLENRPVIREEGGVKSKVGIKDKISLLHSLAKEHHIDVAGIAETHGYNLKARMFQHAPHQSINGRAGGTANVKMNDKVATANVGSGSNWVATQVSMEGIPVGENHNPIHGTDRHKTVMVITAYFPPERSRTKEVIKDLNRFITGWDLPMILMADFNSTETDGDRDIFPVFAPPKDPSRRDLNRFFAKHGWVDAALSAEKSVKGKHAMTHWTPDRARGRRLDRIYTNFTTSHHTTVERVDFVWSDHSAVVLKIWEGEPPPKSDSLRLPEYALKYKEVKAVIRDVWNKWESRFPRYAGQSWEEGIAHIRALDSWDKCKREMLSAASTALRAARKAETSTLCKLKRAWLKREGYCKGQFGSVTSHKKKRDRADKAKEAYQWELCRLGNKKKELAEIRAVKYKGKCNTHFLRPGFLRNSKAKVTNMTADGSEDPKAPRTSDHQIMADNFYKFYKDLYSEKEIDVPTLERMLEQVDLKLNRNLLRRLDKPASIKELEKAIAKLPPGKAAGPDGLPYAVWTTLMDSTPRAFADLFNACKGYGRMMISSREANIIVLPKAKDSFTCSLFRPISLTNTDYKILMRVWADRLGPALHQIIGGHQLGFIPGRDGRENILNLQILMDWRNRQDKRGAVLFLDLMKAFDRVSHQALDIIMRKAGWPPDFIRLVRSTYKVSTATVLVNGVMSPQFEVKSGTRQGCPLSPLLFTLIGEVFNQTLLKNPDFKGLEFGQHTKKVAAYADDTAVPLSSEGDLEIFKSTIADFEKATAMKVNPKKSEAVMLGKWRDKPPEGIPYPIVRTAKYLGCQVGNLTQEDYKVTYADMEARILATYARWNRIGGAVKDRVLIAKTMALSKLWYKASVMPWDIKSLRRIQKMTMNYIWSYKPHKVAWAQAIRPKKRGGLGMWSIVAKVRAANATWGFNLETNKVSPDLKTLLNYLVSKSVCLPEDVRGAPLLHSGALPVDWAIQHVGSPTLGNLLNNWNRIAYRYPSIKVGDYVYWAHEDGELWPGVGQVTAHDKSSHEFVVLYKDFHTPQTEAVPWTCAANSLYKCLVQDWHDNLSGYEDTGETYIEYGRKTRKLISLKQASMPSSRKTCKHGPSFDSVQANKFVYKGQFINMDKVDIGGKPKTIRWRDNVPKKVLLKAFRANWASSCASNIQSFRWLMLNHALPVGDRFQEKELCPLCSKRESIEHALFECSFAKEMWRLVRKGWYDRLRKIYRMDVNPTIIVMPGQGFWNTVCRAGGLTTCPAMWTVVQSITAYHIWRTRCSAKYKPTDATPTPSKEVDYVWKHFYLTLKAELSALSDIRWWWTKRSLRMTPAQARALESKVFPPLDKDMGIIESFLECLMPETERDVVDREEGISNMILPHRNRFSDPYWYEALTTGVC